VYHIRVSRWQPRHVLPRAAVAAVTALACVDPHYTDIRWPIADVDLTELPAQPINDSLSNGVGLRATAMTWGPDSITVTLELENLGDGLLTIERASILLAWEELEYPPDRPREGPTGEPPDPARLELAAGARASLRLKYLIGRPLASAGARLLVRAATRDGVSIVELPTLALPPVPQP
jgi:hypothetical protein